MMLKDLILNIFEKLKIHLKENNKIFVYLTLFFSSYFIFNTYYLSCNKSNEIAIPNPPINANYRGDMNFLECIAEQHNCIYTNLKNSIDHKVIIEVCKNENFCSNPITVSVPK